MGKVEEIKQAATAEPDARAAESEAARLEALRQQEARWQSEARGPLVAAQGERKESFRTQTMDWEIKPLYTPLDLAQCGFDYATDAGFPGEYPFTRGVDANGNRSRLWTMAQVTGFGKGMAWAKRARYMLDQGLQGLILEYDLPTTNGYDSDNPLVAGEVGRAGMALDSLEDLEEAFDLPFDKLKYLMSVCNAPQPVNLAMIIAALEKKGVDPHQLALHIVNGILIEYTCVGRYIYPPEHGLRIATDCFEYIVRHHPHWQPISIIAAQLQPARANVVQELAFSVTIAMAYIDAMLARGFDIDTVAPYFHFVINVDMDFFEGICKLRAFRKVWARPMKERYGATRPEAMKLRVMSFAEHQLAHAAAAAEQHRAARDHGNCLRARRRRGDDDHAAARRGARAAGGGRDPRGRGDPAPGRARDRCGRHHRPAGRLVLRRVADQTIEDEAFAEIERIMAHGRRAESHRAGLFPARTGQRAVPAPARDGAGPAQAGRRESPGGTGAQARDGDLAPRRRDGNPAGAEAEAICARGATTPRCRRRWRKCARPRAPAPTWSSPAWRR